MNWTDLPKEINEDFVSYKGDYDFPQYLSDEKEWVNFKHKNVEDNIEIFEPFLIMELYRFIPYFEGKHVKFHPLNMPYIKIRKIEIVGFVIDVTEDPKYYEYHVDDGTGNIIIYYEKEDFKRAALRRKKIDTKYNKCAKNIDIKSLKTQKCPKHLPNPRPKFIYSPETSISDIAIFEHNWSLETNNGTLGRKLKRCAHVHAVGYCTFDFMYTKKSSEEITCEDLFNAKLYFLANRITCISEHKYNKILLLWINTVVRRRYDENLNEAASSSKT